MNKQLLQTVQEQMMKITRLENLLKKEKGTIDLDEFLQMGDCHGEA